MVNSGMSPNHRPCASVLLGTPDNFLHYGMCPTATQEQRAYCATWEDRGTCSWTTSGAGTVLRLTGGNSISGDPAYNFSPVEAQTEGLAYVKGVNLRIIWRVSGND